MKIYNIYIWKRQCNLSWATPTAPRFGTSLLVCCHAHQRCGWGHMTNCWQCQDHTQQTSRQAASQSGRQAGRKQATNSNTNSNNNSHTNNNNSYSNHNNINSSNNMYPSPCAWIANELMRFVDFCQLGLWPCPVHSPQSTVPSATQSMLLTPPPPSFPFPYTSPTTYPLNNWLKPCQTKCRKANLSHSADRYRFRNWERSTQSIVVGSA